MKINARCKVCSRDFPVDLLTSQSAGHCPFCGVALDPHYGAMLVSTLRDLQAAGAVFEQVLEQLVQYGPNLEIDESTVVEPIRATLAQRAAKTARSA